MRAIIFANGQMNEKPDALEFISPDDLIVAADGGLSHCKTLGATPRIIVGDMDSAKLPDLRRMEISNVEIVRSPRRKDETDLELALKKAVEKGADRILILGALGARWDMTFCNVLLLGAEFLNGIDVRIADGRTEIARVKGGQSVEFAGVPGDRLSIFPLRGEAEGVTLRGLEYSLNDETLPFGSTRGLSNVFKSESARISLKKGILVVLVERGAHTSATGRIQEPPTSF